MGLSACEGVTWSGVGPCEFGIPNRGTRAVVVATRTRSSDTFSPTGAFIELLCSVGPARWGVFSRQRAHMDHNAAILKVIDTSAARATPVNMQRQPRQNAPRDPAERERL